MADLFRFELVSPERLVLAADVQGVQVPGSEGDFGILVGHAPVMTSIRPGILEVTTRSGKLKKFYIRGGFAEANPDKLVVLAQQSIDVEELNKSDLLQEIRDLEEDVTDASNDEQRTKAQFALDRLKELESVLAL
ncbi:MAG: F0F1 ATP synthase subunit epsilon [Hyphomicrobiaceae bacterium]|nr:F0F1 ATP synthase subunit epsilon [Hyphomicrobiaceae bacterium]